MAADADDGVFRMLPVGDFLFQLLVDHLLAGQQAAAAGAGAVFVNGRLGGFLDFLPPAHADIVVASELQDLLAVHDARIQQGGLMGNEVRIVAAAHQRLLALEEMQVFRGVFEPGNRADRNALLRLAVFRAAVEQLLHHPGHAFHRGALAVFLGRDRNAPLLLGLERDAQHLQAVALEVLNKVGAVGNLLFRNVQRLGVHGADLVPDLVLQGGAGAVFRGNGGHFGAGALGAQIQLPVDELLRLIHALELDPLDLDAADQRQVHRGHNGPVQLRIEGQPRVDRRHLARQGIQVLLVRIVVSDIQDQRDILVVVPLVAREAHDADLLRAGKGRESVFQVIRIHVFAGFVDDDVLQAALDCDAPRGVHGGDVARREPSAVQRVRRQDLSFYHASGMDARPADLEFPGLCAFLPGDPVFGGTQRRPHGTAQAPAQAHGGLEPVDRGFRHAVTVDRVISQRVQGAQRLRRRMAAAQDQRFHFCAQEAGINPGEQVLLRQAQAESRRDILHGQGQPAGSPVKPAPHGFFLFHGPFQGLDQVVADQRHHDQQVRRKMPADVHDGIRCPVRQVNVGRAQERNPDHVGHKAQHMVERQERQAQPSGVFPVDDPGVVAENVHGRQRLFADGRSGIGKNPAGPGRSAGAHGHVLTPGGCESDGARSVRHGPVINLPDVSGQSAGLAGDDHPASRFLQESLDHIVRRGSVQQQRVVPRAEHAPEKARPVGAGIHRDPDPAFRRRVLLQVRGIVVRPPGHFRVGHGQLFLTLQPYAAGHVPVVPDQVEQRRQPLVIFQPGGCLHQVCLAHSQPPSELSA